MADAKAQNNSNLTAILFAVFAVLCIVAFLAFRGSDVGQLPKLAGNLGGGPLFGNTIVEALYGAGAASLIGLSWFGLGRFVSGFIDLGDGDGRSPFLEIACRVAVGAAVWSIIWFFLGIAGLYNNVTSLICAAAGVFLAIRTDVWIQKRLPGLPPNSEKALIAAIGFALAISLIGALAPPTAKDTLLYHLALPKTFVEQHYLSFVDGNMASYITFGNEMHNVWAMLLGGLFSPRAAEATAGAINFWFFPLLLMATYGGVRELGMDRRWSLLAALMVAAIPLAFHVASSSYIDLALALYITLAIFALSRWWRDQDRRQLFFIAIFLGAALSIKLTAVFVFAAFGLIVLLRARNEQSNAGKIVLNGFAALLLAGVVASPWYLRTWKETGSPVFPFYMSIWKGQATGWDVERSNLFQAMNSQYGGTDKGVVDYILAPIKLSVTAQPEIAQYYDGVLGVAFLIGLPLVIWALWKFELPIEVRISAGVAGIMFLFWLFSSEQLRYLLPIMPVLGIAIVFSAEAISQKIRGTFRSVAQLSLGAAAVAGLLVSFAWFLQKAPLRVVLGGESRDEYLSRNLDYYSYYQWLNTETTPDSKVWLINMRRDTYDLDRPVFSDYLFEDWTLRKMVWDAGSVQELKAKVAAMEIRYVLTRHDFLFDFDKSTIVDDKKSRAENEAKLKIAKDFILDPANRVQSDDKFSLIKVFSEK